VAVAVTVAFNANQDVTTLSQRKIYQPEAANKM